MVVSADVEPLEDVPPVAVIADPPPSVEVRGPTLVPRGGAGHDREAVRAQADAMGIHPLAAHLMNARGIEGEQAQRAFLDPKLGRLRSPENMAGFVAAIDELVAAREQGIRVGVFGDYDVDGVTTATILATYLEALGVEIVARVARRDGGYGLTMQDVAAFADARCGLVIAGDVGTSDIDEIQALVDQGIRTMVIDHHQVPDVPPPAHAFINPHQAGCGFPFKGLCSAGVAFYLCAALRTRLSATAAPGADPLPDPRAWLDLVAVATVCDMMPLVDENRILVRAGLRQLQRRGRPGLRALLAKAGVDAREPIVEGHLGFKVGPRLNAPGRLGPAEPSLRLLRARNSAEAEPVADQIEALNERRKRHTQRCIAEAMALLEADPRVEQRAGLLVAHDGWIPGVVGIVAAQLTQRYQRPTLVLAIDRDKGEARGSARSVAGIDVRAVLEGCSELVDRFGGHREAAGVSLPAAHVDALTEAFDGGVREQRAATPHLQDEEVVDCVLPLNLVDEALCDALRELGPFGVGFAPPRFVATRLRVDRVKVLKGEHLALTLRQDETRRDAMAFSQASHDLVPGDRIDCIFAPSIDYFRGTARLKLQIERLWKVP